MYYTARTEFAVNNLPKGHVAYRDCLINFINMSSFFCFLFGCFFYHRADQRQLIKEFAHFTGENI